MPDDDTPMCEECDLPMHPFATQTADGWVEGWACGGCGWSFDLDPDPPPTPKPDPVLSDPMWTEIARRYGGH